MNQRTMKHGDWAKIVEARSRKQRPQPKSKANMAFIPVMLLGFLVIAMLWVLVLDSTQESQLPQLKADQKARISRYFSKQFIMGSWQLRETKFTNSSIKVLVEMPTELAMNEEQLTQYIQNSLCPSRDSRVWRDVSQYNLFINLFVRTPRNGTYAECTNPNMSNIS